MLVSKGLIYSARTFPNKLAIIDGHHRYTYKELNERVIQLKHALLNLGIKKGDRVGVLMLNTFRSYELLYSITAIGGIIVPINTRLSAEEIAFMLNDAEPKALFINEEFIPMVSELRQLVDNIGTIVLAEDEKNVAASEKILSYEDLLKQHTKEDLENTLSTDGIDDDDVAAIYYTGGTTGRPKGVMLTHKNMMFNAYQKLAFYNVSEKDVYLHAAPMFHLADAGMLLPFTLIAATHTFVRSFKPQAVLEKISETKTTFILLVPTMINELLNYPDIDHYDVSSLKRIVYGASPISTTVLKKGAEKLPNVGFIQEYGMTETAPLLTILLSDDHVVDGTEEQTNRLSSCGRPVQGVEMKVVDQNGNELPEGEVGEFIAKGPNVMKGYWNLPEETKNALRDNWYYTGDMGYRDSDQYFYIVDRAKDMIITGGENVYSIEVEKVLSQISEINECCVIGVPDEKWGEAVKAVVALKEGHSIKKDEIIAFLRKKLANYKIPKTIDFVDQLPKSGPGKLLKRKLRDQYWGNQYKKVN